MDQILNSLSGEYGIAFAILSAAVFLGMLGFRIVDRVLVMKEKSSGTGFYDADRRSLEAIACSEVSCHEILKQLASAMVKLVDSIERHDRRASAYIAESKAAIANEIADNGD